MTGKPALPFPIWMIALDVMGTLLLGLGLFGLYGGLAVDDMSPAEIQSAAVALIGFGVLLMLLVILRPGWFKLLSVAFANYAILILYLTS